MKEKEETKVSIIRRLVRENDWVLKPNKEVAQLVMKQTGKFISESTIVDAIGTQRARRDEFGDAAFAALSDLFDACRHDVKLVKFMVDSYVKEWHRIRQNPEIKFRNAS